MLSTLHLVEAIAEIEKWRVSRKNMVILAPPNTLGRLLHDSEHRGTRLSKMLCRVSPHKPPEFNGVLVVEDPMIRKIMVKSLVSDHRVEVDISGNL